MNTCGTCEHFGPLVRAGERWDDDANDMVVPHKLHACLLLKHLNRTGNVRYEGEKAGVVDGSGYFATFCVSEEFGCNQWEAADPV